MPASPKRHAPVRIVAEPHYKLPASFTREIGRIMVSWAYFEQSVRRGLWELMGVDDKIGRIASRDPRIDDRIDMFRDLAFLRKIKIDEGRIKLLISRANEVIGWRDLLAHGVWIPYQGKWLIQKTAGQYPKNAISEHRKRRIAPEGVNVDLDGLRTITDGIEILIEMIGEIREEVVEKLRQLPETRLG
jgi:hypothetical protein